MLQQLKQTFSSPTFHRLPSLLYHYNSINYPSVTSKLPVSCGCLPVAHFSHLTNGRVRDHSGFSLQTFSRQFSSGAPAVVAAVTSEVPDSKRRKMTSITTVQRGSLNSLDYRLYYREYN